MDTNTTIKNKIAANISFYRKQLGITQKDLACILGVKTTTVSTWERASSLPDAETLFELCQIFHIALSDIYGCDTATMKESFPTSDFEKKMLEKYRTADTISKEMVHRALGLNISAETTKVGKIS